MDAAVREEIKQNLKKSLHRHVASFTYSTTHPLDLLIPRERKIRSIVGGLETSMGITVWEPIAKALASNNGFEVMKDKILKPAPMPEELAIELGTLIALRESRSTWISANECKKRLQQVCLKIDRTGITYVAPPPGTGVDILLKKGGEYFAFDIKTVQPNVSNVKSFNKQLLEWYAYSICKNPNINLRCMIAYPYNPHTGNFWAYTPHTVGVLEHSVDALAENEFWDFLSGFSGTYEAIQEIFTELRDEGFGKELSDLIEKMNDPTQ